jgi:hypothetical protein
MIWSLTAAAFKMHNELIEEIEEQERNKLNTNVVRTEK